MTIYIIAGLVATSSGFKTNVSYYSPEAYASADACLTRVSEIEKKLSDKKYVIKCVKVKVE